ncbi:hypothetical protein O3M35_004560 [Rhynocoris fuscipes]|uniref:Uncharacterized protein n=1 Tax=Rhynocoris fuscipes TaxID=488301 RepID=A0AAW1CEU4_9HEMI
MENEREPDEGRGDGRHITAGGDGDHQFTIGAGGEDRGISAAEDLPPELPAPAPEMPGPAPEMPPPEGAVPAAAAEGAVPAAAAEGAVPAAAAEGVVPAAAAEEAIQQAAPQAAPRAARPARFQLFSRRHNGAGDA